MRATLERADAVQPQLNCMMAMCHDDAMREARDAEAAILRGDSIELLHGLPFTVKDLVNTRGVRTTFGSVIHKDNIPDEDAVCVARMKRGGAILIGKTTTSEFGAKCLTDGPLFGRTANAWDHSRTSGGSSGGAAASVAGGVTALAIATDGGGSTRIPAACNGVVGLKQSLGVVPHSQVQDAFGNYTYVTPMTRNVADTALMMQAMAGAHSSDPWSQAFEPPRYHDLLHAVQEPFRGRVIAICDVPPGRPLAKDVRAAYECALKTLESLGARLVPFDGSSLDVEGIWRVINHTSWNGRFKPLAEKHGDVMSPSMLQQLALVRDVDGVTLQQAMFERTALYRRVEGLLHDCDFLFTPTLSRTAPSIDQDLFGALEIDGQSFPEVRPNWFPWTMAFNLTGHPAISLPCGSASDGLPVGMQLVGRFKQELPLLQAAQAFESAHQPLRPLPLVAQ